MFNVHVIVRRLLFAIKWQLFLCECIVCVNGHFSGFSVLTAHRMRQNKCAKIFIVNREIKNKSVVDSIKTWRKFSHQKFFFSNDRGIKFALNDMQDKQYTRTRCRGASIHVLFISIFNAIHTQVTSTRAIELERINEFLCLAIRPKSLHGVHNVNCGRTCYHTRHTAHSLATIAE